MNGDSDVDGAVGSSPLAEFQERTKYIPLRLTLDERKLLRLVSSRYIELKKRGTYTDNAIVFNELTVISAIRA